jgi:formylglycine-generating enzyme required for sulfatase activity
VPPNAADLPPLLAEHPQYRVVRELGRGGMGVVYLAHNVLMDRPEVLKVLGPALLSVPGARDRFLREIRAAAKLDHPHVVKAHSALPLGDSLAFAMEYVEGEDLAQLVRRQGPLPVAHACRYARQAALGLQHAHEHGMVHRDIKPHNLILARRGNEPLVKVLDFGLAKAARVGEADTDLTGTGKMMGTPGYMAPEQALDAARADIRADIYGLGCTLYFLLTGAPPFSGRSMFEVLQAQATARPRPLDQVRADLPEGLAAVVARMLAKDPAKRYQTPAEVAQALEPFIQAGILTVALPADQCPREKRPVRPRPAPGARTRGPMRWWLVAGAGLALAVLLLALAGGIALWVGGAFRGPDPVAVLQPPPRPQPDRVLLPPAPKAPEEPPPAPAAPNKGDVQPPTPDDALIAEMQFVHVPKGTFWMGWDSDKKESQQVTIAQDFELAAYTLTQGQWQAIMGYNPSHFSRQGGGAKAVEGISDADLRRFPVETVSWHDVQELLKKLNAREKAKGWVYRLPKEAEWEYACRGAATNKEECSFDFYFAKPTNDLSSHQANFNGEFPAGNAPKGPYLGQPKQVGSHAPNKLGLYDMHGNVAQWCDDLFSSAVPGRVVRGGSWARVGRDCRAAVRGGDWPADRCRDLGCRLARVPSGG